MKGECLAGYYCAGANTGSKGQTADTPQAEKKCAKGFFCPPGSTGEKGRLPKKDDTGGTCTTDAHCLCAAGYYCPEGSTTQFGQVIISSSSKNICPAGSYCPEGWYNKLGKPCKVGYYCPEGSTAETGLPGGDNDVAGCDATTGCTCAQGYLCPERSITMYGGQTSDPTAKNECPAGYVCWAPGNKQNHEVGAKPCPKGYYCTIQTHEPKECAAGYFCPETSTTQHGEPLGEKHDGCTPGECKCKAGYYCPSSSSQSEGYPMTGYGVSPRPMTCTPGFWCPETSTTMEGEPHQDEHTGENSNTQVCAKTTKCECPKAPVPVDSASRCFELDSACPTKDGVTCSNTGSCAIMEQDGFTYSDCMLTQAPEGFTINTAAGICHKVTMKEVRGNTNFDDCHTTHASRRGRSLRGAHFRRTVSAAQQGDTHQQMIDLTPGAAEYVSRMRQRRSHNQSPARYEGHRPDPSAVGSCMESYETHFDVDANLDPAGPPNRPFPTGRTAVLDAAFHYAERRYRRRLSRRRARRDVAEKGTEYTGGAEEGGSGSGSGQFIDDPEVEEIEEAAEAVHVTDYYEKLQDKDESDVGWYADSNANPAVNEGNDEADGADEADHVIRHYIDGVAYGGIIKQTAVEEAALARASLDYVDPEFIGPASLDYVDPVPLEYTDLTRATGEAGKNATDRAAQERQLQQVAAAFSAAGSQDANASTAHLRTSAQLSGLVGATPAQNRPAARRHQESATAATTTSEEKAQPPRVETKSGGTHKKGTTEGKGGEHDGVGPDTKHPKGGAHKVPGHRGEWVQMPEREAAALKEKLIASGALGSMMDTLATQKPVTVSATHHVPRAMPPSPPESLRKKRDVSRTGTCTTIEKKDGTKVNSCNLRDKEALKEAAKNKLEPEPSFTLWLEPNDMTTHTGMSLTLSLPTKFFFPLTSITFGISTNNYYCQEDFDSARNFNHPEGGYLAGLFNKKLDGCGQGTFLDQYVTAITLGTLKNAFPVPHSPIVFY